MKIFREGFTVWIDKKGGQDQVTAINYPLPNHTSISTAEDDKQSAGQWQQGNGSPVDRRRLEAWHGGGVVGWAGGGQGTGKETVYLPGRRG